MSTDKKIVISTDNVYWRTTFRILLLLMPYWLLYGGYCFFVLLATLFNPWSRSDFYFRDTLQLLSVPAFFVCSAIFLVCRTNYLRLNNQFLRLPWLCSIPLAQLEQVSPVFNDGKVTHIQFLYGWGRSVIFPTSRLDGNRLDTLIKELKIRCQPGIISQELEQIRDQKDEVVPDHNYSINYRSRQGMQRFFKVFVSFEKQFWRAWMLVFIAPTLILVPFALMLLYKFATGNSWDQHWQDNLTSFFNILEEGGVKPFLTGVNNYYNFMNNPLLGFGGSLVILSCLYAIVKILFQPNHLYLSPSGLSLRVKVFRRVYMEKMVAWSDITEFGLFKPHNSTDTEHWSIKVGRVSGEPVLLKFGAISTEADRRKFIAGIDRYAAHAKRDAELLQALAPANKRSYTELWLQSLAAPTERKNLVPLVDGQSLAEGRYKIENQLGVGGQGIAYLACDSFAPSPGVEAEAGQKIVLKEFVLPVHVEKKVRQKALERFQQESDILRGLDHPGIVKVVDNFVEDHRGYLVLEHIDGKSLRTLVDEGGAMNEERVLELLEQMLSILEYVHGLSPPLVHRDFTPDNLILDKRGVLKLIDFNVAQQMQKGGTANVVGKHSYLPPEQFRGRPSTRSDIYALGCTLYFLVKGHDPEPLTRSVLSGSFNQVLKEIIENCTVLDENERYSSASDIRQTLSNALRAMTLVREVESG